MSVARRIVRAALAVLAATGASSVLAAANPPAAPVPAPVAQAAAAPDYRIGAGDALHILVCQNPDLTLDARVSDSGMISYPLLGGVKVGGLTVSETEGFIANGLRKGDFVKSPQVTVVLMQVRGSQVSVLGQVNRPGRYPLEVAQMRLSDVLALAGGITTASGSDVVTVVGTRDGKPMRQDVDLPRVFGGGDRQSDLVLQNNDVVYVDRAPLVYIYGEVQRPGSLRIERGMTVMQALASGGGLTQRGTEKGIRVHRHDDASGKVQVLQPSMDDPVRDGDVIYVRESLF